MDCKVTLRGGRGFEFNTLEFRQGGPVNLFTLLNFYRTPDKNQEAEQAEQWLFGLTPREALRKAGVFSGNFWLAHCV